jgi:outer membrane protein assembly factor BamB/tRNA A-37 threonylcarbamoyl transferase component Bud32
MTHENTLYLATERALISLSSEDGHERWRFTDADDYSGLTPQRVGDESLLVPGEKRVSCLTTTDGTRRWQFSRTDSESTANPWVYDRRVYLADDQLHALSLESGDTEWTFDPSDPISTVLPTNKSVYVGTVEGAMHALSPDTGREQWRFTASGEFGRAYAELEPVGFSGRPNRVNDPPSGLVYGWLRRDDRLYAVSRNDGSEQWRFTLDEKYFPFPGVVTSHGVYLANGLEYLSLSPNDGSVRWQFDAGANLRWFSSAEDDTAYVHTDGKLHALDLTNGTRRWEFPHGGTRTVVVPEAGVRAVGDDPGVSVVALDALSGSVQWWYDTDDSVETALVGDQSVYLSTTAGTVSSVSAPQSLGATLQRAVRRNGSFVAGATALGVTALGAYRYLGSDSDPDGLSPESLELERKIGESRYAEVYRARDGADESVALKRFSTDAPVVADALDDWASVDAKGVYPVLERGIDSSLWVLLPLAKRTLADVPDDLSTESGAEIIATVASAVHRLHKEDIAHGHLVPENVLFVDSEPTVSDCGVRAALTDDDPTVPDDVRALGELARRVLMDGTPVEDAAHSRSDQQERFAEVLSTALAADPGDRYDSALKFADALRWAVRE